MRTKFSPHQLGVALAFFGMLLVSLDSLGVRLTGASDWDIAFWFGAFTATAMFIVVPLRSRQSFLAAVKVDGSPVIASGLLQALSTLLFILAIGATTVSNVVVIFATAPIVAAIIAHFILGESTSRRTRMGILISIVGISVVVSGSVGGGRLLGDVFAVGAIITFSANLTIWRKLPDQNRMVAIGLGGLFMALVAWFPAQPLAVDARAIAILAAIGGVLGPAGRVMVASATRYITGAQVGLFVPVETVAATTWAWLFLDEPAPLTTVLGGLIVLGAVWYGSREPAPTNSS